MKRTYIRASFALIIFFATANLRVNFCFPIVRAIYLSVLNAASYR